MPFCRNNSENSENVIADKCKTIIADNMPRQSEMSEHWPQSFDCWPHLRCVKNERWRTKCVHQFTLTKTSRTTNRPNLYRVVAKELSETFIEPKIADLDRVDFLHSLHRSRQTFQSPRRGWAATTRKTERVGCNKWNLGVTRATRAAPRRATLQEKPLAIPTLLIRHRELAHCGVGNTALTPRLVTF